MTLTDFLKASKGLLIAPAGHGKTHTIGNCVKLCPDNSVQLILTHPCWYSFIKSEVQETWYIKQQI